MSMFKLSDVLLCLISWGVGSLFKMRGRQVGGGGADRDSNWRLSIDPCRKCHFIRGLKGDGFLTEGAQAPQPPTVSDYVPALGLRLTAAAPCRIILIIGPTLMFWGVERRHQEIGRWKEEF